MNDKRKKRHFVLKNKIFMVLLWLRETNLMKYAFTLENRKRNY